MSGKVQSMVCKHLRHLESYEGGLSSRKRETEGRSQEP